MKLMDLAKKMGHASDCNIIIKQGAYPIKAPQRACELEQKIKDEIIENFTVHFFSVIKGDMIIHIK